MQSNEITTRHIISFKEWLVTMKFLFLFNFFYDSKFTCIYNKDKIIIV